MARSRTTLYILNTPQVFESSRPVKDESRSINVSENVFRSYGAGFNVRLPDSGFETGVAVGQREQSEQCELQHRYSSSSGTTPVGYRVQLLGNSGHVKPERERS